MHRPGLNLLFSLRLLWAVILVFTGLAAFATYSPDRVQTSLVDLVPQEATTQHSSLVLDNISRQSAQTILVLIQSPDSHLTLLAGKKLYKLLDKSGLTVQSADASGLQDILRVLQPYREYFLTETGRQILTNASDASLVRRALKNLYAPVSLDVLPWQDDPLGLFGLSLREALTDPRFSISGDLLTIGNPADPRSFCVFLRIQTDEALSIDTASFTQERLEKAKEELQLEMPSVRIAAAGPLIISQAVSTQASQESTFIGLISAAAIGLMVLVALRSLLYSLWMVAVLAIGFAFATSVVWLVFGGIHLLSLVFGATLLGIAADYVFHYLTELFTAPCALQAARQLYRGLGVSLLTSLVGYSTLYFIPMPVLHQVGLFCMTGLTCAYATVLLYLPLVIRGKPISPPTWWIAEQLRNLFANSSRGKQALIATVLVAALAPGLLRLHNADDLTLLNSIPQDVLADQKFVSERIFLSSPGQFFLVHGADSNETLSHLQQFIPWLETAKKEGWITGYQTGASLLQTEQKQLENYALVHEANRRARQLTSEKLQTTLAMPDPLSSQPLRVEDWLESSAGRFYQPLWLSAQETVVLLSGVTMQSLPSLAQADKMFSFVHFVNTTGQIRESLSYWKKATVKILAGAFCVMLLFLCVIYKRNAWRLMLPTALGLACTAGILGWIGVPLSLFIVLPMVLLLGLGSDYAVLLHTQPKDPIKYLSITLAMASTLLSFGLLSFSSTPALHLFGLTLGIGIGLIWLFTMLLHPKS